jgi:hypothetical protein
MIGLPLLLQGHIRKKAKKKMKLMKSKNTLIVDMSLRVKLAGEFSALLSMVGNQMLRDCFII